MQGNSGTHNSFGTSGDLAQVQIDRRSQLSYEEFAEKYLYANRPVVVTDVMREWKALSRWTPEFFRNEFGSMTFTLPDANAKSGYKDGSSNEYTMARLINLVLNSTDEMPAPYLRNIVLYDTFPSLRDDIEPLPE